MPGEVACLRECEQKTTLEVLFPNKSTGLLIYDQDRDIYRAVIIRCSEDDLHTRVYHFVAEEPDIDMAAVLEIIGPFCNEEYQYDDFTDQGGDLIEAHVRPGLRLNLFIGHQAVFSNS